MTFFKLRFIVTNANNNNHFFILQEIKVFENLKLENSKLFELNTVLRLQILIVILLLLLFIILHDNFIRLTKKDSISFFNNSIVNVKIKKLIF